jgi:hypothetical protein
MKVRTIVAVVVMLFVPSVAFALINTGESVEWMTVDSELIVRGKVFNVVKSPAPDNDYVFENITVKVSEVIKGEYKETTITFQWRTYKWNDPPTSKTWSKDTLFFLIKKASEKESGKSAELWSLRCNWHGVIDLERPDTSAINADFEVLKKSEDILKCIKERLKVLKSQPQECRHTRFDMDVSVFARQDGFIRLEVPRRTEAYRALYSGSACYLIVPPDRKYKEHAVKLCKSESAYLREHGADMLRNYRDHDTIELLKTLLKDEEKTQWSGSNPACEGVDYPVRKEAYSSLLTLGVRVEKPVLAEVLKGKWSNPLESASVVTSKEAKSKVEHGGLLFPIRKYGKYGFADRNGKVIIVPQFGWASQFSEGLACVNFGDGSSATLPGFNGKWGYINKAGELAIKARFDDAWDFSEGLARVRTEKKWGYIDKAGDTVIELSFDKAGNFSEGLAAVQTDGKWGYLDKTGKLVVKPRFDSAEKFHNGLARVWIDQNLGLIDKTGEYVWKPSK